MTEQEAIPEDIVRAILVVRDLGVCNMFDVSCVCRCLELLDLSPCAIWIRSHKGAYSRFIMSGQQAA